MADQAEPGSDDLLREIAPDAGDRIRTRLEADREHWRAEQDRVDAAYAGDDPGRQHPDPDERPE